MKKIGEKVKKNMWMKVAYRRVLGESNFLATQRQNID